MPTGSVLRYDVARNKWAPMKGACARRGWGWGWGTAICDAVAEGRGARLPGAAAAAHPRPPCAPDTLRAGAVATPRSDACAAAHNGKLYLMGGYSGAFCATRGCVGRVACCLSPLTP